MICFIVKTFSVLNDLKKGNYVIRFTVTSSHTKLSDIQRDWEIIKSIAAIVIDACYSNHAINMAGDDQLEENGHSSGQETGDDEATAGLPRSKTTKIPLAGKIWPREVMVVN